MIVHSETGWFEVRKDRLYFFSCRLFKSAIGGSSILSQVTGCFSEMDGRNFIIESLGV